MNRTPGLAVGAGLAALLLLALAIRLAYLPYIDLDADMAVTGLMARHILEGQFPIFFYGQPFCGSIEAYVAAAIFALAGSTPQTLCLAPLLVALALVAVAFLAARNMWGPAAGWWTGLLVAAPPYYFAIHGILPRAAYIEIPLFSLLLFWLTFRLVHRRASAWLHLAYGLVAGLGLWTHFLIAYALLATALYQVLADWRMLFRRGHVLIWLGFFVGGAPFWWFNLTHHWESFHFLLQPKPSQPFGQVFEAVVGVALPVLLGAWNDATLQPLFPWVSQGIALLGLLGLGNLIWMRRRALWGLARLDARACDGSELFLLAFLLGIALIVVKGEPVGSTRRHFVPLYAALIPLTGYLLARLGNRLAWLALGLGGLLLVSNLAGAWISSPLGNQVLRQTIQAKVHGRQEFIAALLARGVTRAYSLDYWDCPLLTFESGERLIVVRAGEELDHFYEPHHRLVAQAPRPAWICRGGPRLLESTLRNLGAASQRLVVGGYTAFFDITPPQPGWRAVDRREWRARGGDHPQDAPLAWDGDALTRWSPLAAQAAGQMLELDLGQEVPDLCRLRLASGRVDDQPCGLRVLLSRDGQTWTQAIHAKPPIQAMFWCRGKAMVSDGAPRLDVCFPPQPARYLRLVQTGQTRNSYWSIQELSLYRPGSADPPVDPAAVVEHARRQGVTTVFGDLCLKAWLPHDLRPAPQAPPSTPSWPMPILPRDVLPADLGGVMVALDPSQADYTLELLANQGIRFREADLGGHRLFWDLRPSGGLGSALSPVDLSLRANVGSTTHPARDNNPASRWDTGRPRQAGDRLEMDLGRELVLAGLGLEAQPAPQDLPVALELELSSDGQNWRRVDYRRMVVGPLVFGGDRLLTANTGRLRLEFSPQAARHLRLRLIQGHPRLYWSVYELSVWLAGPGAPNPG
ncbi:MAG: glycosyltransferase family 39 protein [Desulfarculus sp.]|nr:glycosyltransferase family 39 protein [Desulfarculus sp.]